MLASNLLLILFVCLRQLRFDGGRLGSGGDLGGVVCTTEPRAAVSAAGEGQGGGVWEHAN